MYLQYLRPSSYASLIVKICKNQCNVESIDFSFRVYRTMRVKLIRYVVICSVLNAAIRLISVMFPIHFSIAAVY